MNELKLFLESDLTLAELARAVEASPHQVSQVLNQHRGVNFYDYVNRRRVEEVQRCLADPAYGGQTVLDIGLAAGFSSKSTFNAVFKRETGMTPQAYRSATRPPPAGALT
jgi:AraC-like DNA-binding protein